MCTQSSLQSLLMNYFTQDLIRTQEQLSIKTGEIKSLKKENRKRRKVIEAYQDLINLGATGVHTVCTCIRARVDQDKSVELPYTSL